MQYDQRSVMIVSRKCKMLDFIKSTMPSEKFSPVYTVASAAEARRTVLAVHIDIVIIYTPLTDEFGTKLARDLSRECAVAIIVRSELTEKTAYNLEPYGVVTLPSTLYKTVFYQTLTLLASSVTKMKMLRDDSENLKAKLREIKTVSKAKLLLVSEKGFTEEEAHRYIEKMAMDTSRKKIEVARSIIAELSGDDI